MLTPRRNGTMRLVEVSRNTQIDSENIEFLVDNTEEDSKVDGAVAVSTGKEEPEQCKAVRYQRSLSAVGGRGHSLRDTLRMVDQQRLYLCSKRGNTFVVYGDNGERYSVVVGPQTCSCSQQEGSQASLGCMHILFVMCKVLKVGEEDLGMLSGSLCHQQVEELFRRFNRMRRKLVQLKHTCLINDAVGERSKMVADPLDLDPVRDSRVPAGEETLDPFQAVEEIACSICLQEMRLSQSLMYCQHCSNEFHRRCITIFQKECAEQEEDLSCPLCRHKWSPEDGGEVGWPSSDVPNSRDYKCQTSPALLQQEQSTHAAVRAPYQQSPLKCPRRSSLGHKPLGYCFPSEIGALLASKVPEKREEGLRSVVGNTVQTVLSASSSFLTSEKKAKNTINSSGYSLVSSMGGYTTRMMLKEAFRVIASLLDDSNFQIFLGALRALRDIFGFVVCIDEKDLERMTRMITPVLYQLLRLSGDLMHKTKAQMSLSALFELSKGQDGGMALGRELNSTSLQVTGQQRMAKFVLSDSSRFKAAHSYGRLAILEKLVERFHLSPDILQKILNFVANHFVLLDRCARLTKSGSGGAEEVELMDLEAVLSSSDILLFSSHRLHKLARNVFIKTSSTMISKQRFLGWSKSYIHMELWKLLDTLPQSVKEKMLQKLKLPEMKKLQYDIKTKDKGIVNEIEGYKVSKASLNVKDLKTNERTNVLRSANSVNSLKMTTKVAGRGSCQLSSLIRITPEPAYDSIPGSDSEDETLVGHSSLFFSQLAMHNATYELRLHDIGLNQQNETERTIRSNERLRFVIRSLKQHMDEVDVESQAPPGLEYFTCEYRAGYEWSKGRLLGTGAFSKCYQARDVKTGLLMAVKQIAITHQCIDKNEEVIKAVKTEVNLMGQLRHPNVLPLLGAVYSPTDNTISMFVRWMPGGSVTSLLGQYGPFLETTTIAYSIQLSRGLSYIHSNGILHRDLKGANLLLDGSGIRLTISDFGASARLSNGRDSNTGEFKGQLLGTIAFMAPEVLRGEEYGRSCDVWSFACCIIEMLTADQPWRDQHHTNHIALMYSIASAVDPPTLPDNISVDLTLLLKDCLTREPKNRPLSCQLEKYKVLKEFIG